MIPVASVAVAASVAGTAEERWESCPWMAVAEATGLDSLEEAVVEETRHRLVVLGMASGVVVKGSLRVCHTSCCVEAVDKSIAVGVAVYGVEQERGEVVSRISRAAETLGMNDFERVNESRCVYFGGLACGFAMCCHICCRCCYCYIVFA
jgi:hypothetical protein